MTYPPPAGYPDPNQPQPGWSPNQTPPIGQPELPPSSAFADAGAPQLSPPGAYPPPSNESFLPPQEPKKRGNAGVLIGLLIFVIVVAGAVTAYFLGVFDPAASADDDKKTETTTEETGEEPGKETGDDSEEPADAGAPTAAVEAYYVAAQAHDSDGLLATLCASTKAEYDDRGMSDDEWQQLWDAADKAEYTIVKETIAEDGTTADVTVEQTVDGTTKTVTANMVLEEDQWKICGFA